MSVLSMYLSHNDKFSDVDPNVISLTYSMYTLANIGNKSSHSQSFLLVYVRPHSELGHFHTVNICIRLSIGIQVHFFSCERFAANLPIPLLASCK